MRPIGVKRWIRYSRQIGSALIISAKEKRVCLGQVNQISSENRQLKKPFFY